MTFRCLLVLAGVTLVLIGCGSNEVYMKFWDDGPHDFDGDAVEVREAAIKRTASLVQYLESTNLSVEVLNDWVDVLDGQVEGDRYWVFKLEIFGHDGKITGQIEAFISQRPTGGGTWQASLQFRSTNARLDGQNLDQIALRVQSLLFLPGTGGNDQDAA